MGLLATWHPLCFLFKFLIQKESGPHQLLWLPCELSAFDGAGTTLSQSTVTNVLGPHGTEQEVQKGPNLLRMSGISLYLAIEPC